MNLRMYQSYLKIHEIIDITISLIISNLFEYTHKNNDNYG